MKTKYFLIAALAGLALVGCNKGTKDAIEGEGTKQYIAFNIFNGVPETATKVGTSDGYAATEAESQVENAQFLFFRSGAYVAEGTAALDAFTWGSVTTTGNTIERVSNNSPAVIVLESDGAKPNQVLCFLNLDPTIFATLKGKTLKEVLAITDKIDFDKYAYTSSGKNYFVMASAAYKNGSTSKLVQARDIDGMHISTDKATAQSNPMDIYVERIASKVEGIAGTGWSTDAQDATIDAVKYNFELLGWSVNAVNHAAYLVKNLTDDFIASLPAWMPSESNRLAWEMDPNYTVAQVALTSYADDAKTYAANVAASPLHYYSANQMLASSGKKATVDADNNITGYSAHTATAAELLRRQYGLPNTIDETLERNNRKTSTVLTVLARVKKDGAATFDNVVKYLDNLYSVDDYKDAAITNVSSTYAFYTAPKDNFDAGTKKISAGAARLAKTDVKIVNAQVDPSTHVVTERVGYANGLITIVLDESVVDHSTTEIFICENPLEADPTKQLFHIASNAELEDGFQKSIMEAGNGYNGGLLYFTVPIEHLGPAPTGTPPSLTYHLGNHGFVRNHWYKVTLGTVTGLGHGIWDPEEPIVPGDHADQWYLAANININAWHVVNQTAELKD